MAFKMKGSSLYGKVNLNRGGNASRPDGRKDKLITKFLQVRKMTLSMIKKEQHIKMQKNTQAQQNIKRKAHLKRQI